MTRHHEPHEKHVTVPQTDVRVRPSPTAAARAARPSGTEFRTDIEGLRGIAVLAVVFFHAAVPGFTGGFVGVDVFFVVSGFLITGLLVDEARITGGVSLHRFYAARARRLLPAAGTVLVATAIGAVFLLPSLQARETLGDAVASALYVGNYRFALHDTDYLAAAAPSPFQHYWSLGVEEQFYLLWPVLIIVTGWFVRRKRERSRGGTGPYLLVLAAVAAGSFALSVAWTRTQPAWAFFSLPTRAWELAVGGLVALTIPAWRRLPTQSARVAGLGGVGLILITCVQFDTDTPYPGSAAILPVLGTALVIGTGCATTQVGAGRWLSVPSIRAIGRLSYSWYLWHWPVLLFAPLVLGHVLGLAERLAVVGISAGLAVLTMRYVENPGRFAPALRGSAHRSLAFGAAITSAGVCVTLLLLLTVPDPVGRGEAAPPPVPISADRATGSEAGPLDPYEAVRQAVAASVPSRAVPSNLTPPLATAESSKPTVFVNGCVRSWQDVGHPECASGATAPTTTVALVGDSHAAMWQPAFEPMAAERHWRLETLAKVTCPLMDLPITSPYLGRQFTECTQWRGEILARLQSERPDLIVLSMSRRYGADFGFTSYDPAWLDSLTRKVAQLRATGAHVVVLGPIPDPHSIVPNCLSAHLDDAGACGQDRSVAVNDAGIAAEKAATAAGGGQYADLTDLFCTAARCPVIVGDTLVFRDDNHVTIEYAEALAQVVTALADSAIEARPS